jgi:predicted SnoaL-like aldol condensation-catalyzing enzyme
METTERNKTIVCRFNKEFIENGHDEVFDESVDARFIYHSRLHGAAEGRRAYWDFFEQALRPAINNLRVDIHDMVAEGDKVITVKTYYGTLKEEDQDEDGLDPLVEVEVTEIVRLENGKFVECWNIMNVHDIGIPWLQEENSIY